MIFSSILKTLAYADIFDYPLTGHEVANYLISKTEVKDKVVQKTLKILTDPSAKFTLSKSKGSGQVYTDGEFYFLKGRNSIVDLRKKREEWSKQKREIARRTADKLKIIPAIKMIGVTGALAMDNCKEDDDIDLLIITSKNCLWLTRLLLVLGAPLLGIKRRKPKDTEVNNKICFNLFLDEDHLKISPENLFLAHEIAQVKVIYGKGGIYERFLQENKWVSNFLPNVLKISNFKFQISNSREGNLIPQYISILMSFLNTFAFKLQLWYMKPKMTSEKVSLYQAFFHPNNMSGEIEKKYKKKLYRLGIDKYLI